MSYIPTTWMTGDVVTADKLNNLESGVLSASGGGVFAIHEIYDEVEHTFILDKTWQEINDALSAGKFAYIIVEEEYAKFIIFVLGTSVHEADAPNTFSYDVEAGLVFEGAWVFNTYSTDSETGYPEEGNPAA